MFIPDPDADFLSIPDPRVKKAPNPGYGYATLKIWQKKKNICIILSCKPSIETGQFEANRIDVPDPTD